MAVDRVPEVHDNPESDLPASLQPERFPQIEWRLHGFQDKPKVAARRRADRDELHLQSTDPFQNDRSGQVPVHRSPRDPTIDDFVSIRQSALNLGGRVAKR